MSEMVERVAKAMCLHDHGFDIWEDQAQKVRDQYLDRVCAAIEAMREPTKPMLEAADCDTKEQALTIWGEMIDEALK